MERFIRYIRIFQLYLGPQHHEENMGRIMLTVFLLIFLGVFGYKKEDKLEELRMKLEAKNAEFEDVDEEEMEDALARKEEQQKAQQKQTSASSWISSKPDGALLPPVSNDMFGRPMRTIVLALHDVILHAEWRRMEGWRFQKRPYFDEFVQRMIDSGYEIVLWSDKAAQEVEQLLQDLDPSLKMKHRLFDDSLSREYFSLKKDPSLLSRELRRLIVIDYKTENYANDQNNILKLPRFEGDVNDNSLLKTAEILEKIQKYNVFDVTNKIISFNHAPENYKKLFEQEEDDERAALALKGNNADERKKTKASSAFAGILSNVKSAQLPNSVKI